MNQQPKTVSQSRVRMTELVMPNDTNPLGNLMGGRLLQWMDACAAIAAQRHSNRVCVTVSVDFVEFRSPIKLGEVVLIEGAVTRAFRTSMEVGLVVQAENPFTGDRRLSNRAYYTFVAVDQNGRPIPVPEIRPETSEEQAEYENALKRRELRLLLAGRLKLSETDSSLREELLRILGRA
ncbi:MAG: acyl-CoA thioesterase [Bacteroidetes bacterium]|nr:acyl-CoA thioesterase [Rhodothermia bacterium]MCS7154441.1 acyl-CoA thioesterase [Bacteroidota bacterium]MCX7906814.1 acyl-CoA thioesterase [Bacteroidota bacterium]MDW8136907.1 acyl-CoA thioesterase [Bacteroidota bacterium]MDW8285223.1 acyl-CoA thioesterase [Bacteroidota bacterium]